MTGEREQMAEEMRRFTEAENTVLTQIARGTPMGEFLRRYWWPVNVSAELKDKPTLVRVFGENLVLFRDRKGQVGLIGSQCAHRRANLCFGTLSGGGLRCRYHGWVYDVNGKLIETPGEPADSTLKDRVTHPAYPVQELGGLIWAYFGPQPAPLLPPFDFLAAEGERYARITGISNCHWLQCSENGLDPFHVNFTHAVTWTDLDVEPDLVDFQENEYGLRYRTWRKTKDRDEEYYFRDHYWLMPGLSLGSGGSVRLLEGGSENVKGDAMMPKTARFSTPIDETHTLITRVHWLSAKSGLKFARRPMTTAEWQAVAVEPYQEQRNADNPVLGYDWPKTIATQDATLQDSIGPVLDRHNENLSVIDRGTVLLREMLLHGIADVKRGRDPKGVLRSSAGNDIIEIDCRERYLSEEQYRKERRDALVPAG